VRSIAAAHKAEHGAAVIQSILWRSKYAVFADPVEIGAEKNTTIVFQALAVDILLVWGHAAVRLADAGAATLV